ncbi:MAG TPA: sulfatase [Planctomycetota bacterium]|nr:sulfatase [Planctomycetota bacterium]
MGVRIPALLAAAALVACSDGERDARPSVLLVTIDSLRADRIGGAGYARELTPNLDALAAEGVRFERAYSHAPFTAPSHASLLTSLLTPSHGVLAWAEELAPEAVTLADRFGAAGYRTAAFYNNPGLATSRMARGFDVERRFFWETADTTLDAFFEWLDEGRGPTCAWVHLWDVHRPYAWRDWSAPWLVEQIGEREPVVFAYGEERFGAPTSLHVGRSEEHYNLHPERRAAPVPVGDARRALDERDLAYLAARYDAGVLEVDRGLGRLFEGLRARGLLDDTLVVVTSDHGESLTEREACYFAHDPFLYEETLRVPLVMRFPGAAYAGTRVADVARLVDVLPTLYEVARLRPTGVEQGRSLLGRIEGRDRSEVLVWAQTQTRNAKERSARAEGDVWLEHRIALSDGRHKLIRDLESGRDAYFDLEEDPGERWDRIDDPAVQAHVERLRAALRALDEGLPRAGDTGRELDPAVQQALDQMGYGGGGG